VPILALEGLGPLQALDRSAAALFRAKWGEQLVGTASIDLLFAVFGTVPALALVFLGLASGSTPIAVGCFVVGILGLYGCFASVVNATWHRTVIPLGSRE